MRYSPHKFFYKSQSTVKLDLPNDVLYSLLNFVKRVNKNFDNGYKLTSDDIFSLALEDLLSMYEDDIKAFLKRIQS